MRWFAVLALLLVFNGSTRAAGPDDQYLDVYNEILQADHLRQNGQPAAALAKYVDAQTVLKRIKEENPAWNTAIVSFRLDYLAEQIQALAKVLPAAAAPPTHIPAPPQAAAEAAGLQEQIRTLTAANAQLENKLKEALSIQPAPVNPRDQEKILALQKENDLLSVALQQAKAARTPGPPATPADKTARQLAEANQALADLKKRFNKETKAAQNELALLKDSLAGAEKQIVADATQIDSLKSARPSKDTKAAQAELALLKVSLADAQKRIAADTTEIESLKSARSGEQTKANQAELAQLKDSLADAQKKITADAIEIESLKSAGAPEDPKENVPEDSKDIAAERDKLKEELASRTRDLADAEAHREPSAADLRAQLAEAHRQIDEWKAKLAAAPAGAPIPADTQVEQLRARLAVLEAKAVPYTPEELAMLRQSPAPAPAQTPPPAPAQTPPPAPAQTPSPALAQTPSPTPPQAPVPAPARAPVAPLAQGPVALAEHKHIVHSMKDLPPGSGSLMAEAERAMRRHDFAKAAEKYQEILHQDENNVFVLGHLATAQLALNQFAECEKTVARSLAADPEDAPALYNLGVLRFHAEKLNEALDALSLSAKYEPDHALTQYYLGKTLAAKGMHYAAETAFRKALVLEPNYAEAHYGLAWVYALEKPPSVELARWHYQRALDLGYDKNKTLEDLLAPTPH